MKKIDKETLVDASNRLLFSMSDEQYETLLEEFDVLTKQMGLIGQIEGLDEFEPMTFPFDVTTDFLRDDVAVEPLSQEDTLKNAGNVMEGQIKLPKVVG